jgi:hypothetical protein
MGVRFPSVQTSTFVGPFPASNAETVVLVTPPLNLPLDLATVFIQWLLAFAGGTGVTSFQYRLRRGTTAGGALVTAGIQAMAATAGVNNFHSGVYFDTPGAVAGQQYALTVQQFTATGASTFNDGSMLAFVL